MAKSVLFGLLVALPAVFAALPNGWKACSKSATDYNSCLKKEITNAVNTLISGDKGLGVLPLDPLRLEFLKIPRGKGPVSMDLSFSNIDITGVKDFEIQSLKNDWKTLRSVIHVPDLTILGNYKVDGQVMVLPIKGDGTFNITLDSLSLDIDIAWIHSQMKSIEVFQMEKFHVGLRPERAYIQLNNLFNGDKTLGEQMNKFLNENWQPILEELRPALGDGISQAFTQISNRIMSRIPANEVDI